MSVGPVSTKTKVVIAAAAAVVIVALCAAVTFTVGWDALYSAVFGKKEPAGSPVGADGTLSVHFIDVGQGDCELITCGGHAVLVDGGEKEAADKVISYLKRMGVASLDCIVATHPHSDHIGALPAVMNEFRAQCVIMPQLSEINIPATPSYDRLMTALERSDAPVYAAVPGDKYSFGDISFEIYNPSYQSEELNDMSVVFRLVYGSNSFLLTGDIHTDAELQLVDSSYELRSDVLKVPHHGSSTSSAEEFISAVAPQVAVISCGMNNSFNHPNQGTLATLEKLGIPYYRTDYNGDVVITSDGSVLTVSTEK